MENNKLEIYNKNLIKSAKKSKTVYMKLNADGFDDRKLKYRNVETIVYPENLVEKTCYFYVYNSNLENIILSKRKDLHGLTIDYDKIIDKNIDIDLSIRSKTSNINLINIVFKDKVVPIKLDNLYSNIYISRRNDNKLHIDIHTYYKFQENVSYNPSNIYSKEYVIDQNANIEVEHDYYNITENDIENGVLDLSKFSDYEEIDFLHTILIIDKLIINTKLFKNHVKLPNINIKEIQVVNNDDMRLIPKQEIITVNKYINCEWDNIKNIGIFVHDLENEDKAEIINIDKEANVNIINKDYIYKTFESVDSYKMVDTKDRFLTNSYSIAIIKTNNNFITIINGKRYNISGLFKKYMEITIPEKYAKLEWPVRALANNEWDRILSSGYIVEDLYNDFENFIKKIKNLKSQGLSNKTLYYSYVISHENNGEYKMFDAVKRMIELATTQDDVKFIEEVSKKLIKK